MPTMSEVAAGLRKLADNLDKTPEVEIPKAFVYWGIAMTKESFLALAGTIPRPFQKSTGGEGPYQRYEIDHEGSYVDIKLSTYRSNVCHLVTPAQPAVYECDPILSQKEEDSIIAAE